MNPAVLDAPPTPAASPAPSPGGTVLHTAQGTIRLPGPPPSFEAVRAWKNSDDRPTTGRYTYLGDRFEIDLTMESLNSHSTPKVEIASALRNWAKQGRRAVVTVDAFSLVEPSVDLSCEPDVLLVLRDSIQAGRVTLTPKVNREGEWTEAVGAADLVVEVVSDSSTAKDVRLEPPLLFAAGVREFWRADCRGERCELAVMSRGAVGWEPVEEDADGFRRSAVLGQAVRLARLPDEEDGIVEFDLELRE